RECPDEEEDPETPMTVGLAAGCTLIAPQQVTITGVNPGDITVDVSINGAPRTQLRLLDLRPETTVLVFMERDADGRLSLLAHRRITERFDDFDDNGQWVVEEVDNDG
ncbi:MAG: hypothetical protein AAFX99_31755, partial [Myxococcota bacterium]